MLLNDLKHVETFTNRYEDTTESTIPIQYIFECLNVHMPSFKDVHVSLNCKSTDSAYHNL